MSSLILLPTIHLPTILLSIALSTISLSDLPILPLCDRGAPKATCGSPPPDRLHLQLFIKISIKEVMVHSLNTNLRTQVCCIGFFYFSFKWGSSSNVWVSKVFFLHPQLSQNMFDCSITNSFILKGHVGKMKRRTLELSHREIQQEAFGLEGCLSN